VTVATLAALAALAAACNSNDLLHVDTPASGPVGLIEEPKNATLAVNIAGADYE
jgi:hypothetical protein